MLKPTGHRMLIQPDAQPERDGAILLPQHREYVSTSGTVIAIGPRGSKVRWDARQRALQDAVATLVALKADAALVSHFEQAVLKIATTRLLALIGSPDPEHDVHVGDRVAFDYESGLRLTENGTEYLIMNEDDVVVIVEESEAVA